MFYAFAQFICRPDYVPKLYYINVGISGMIPVPGDDVLLDKTLGVVYTFSPVSKLNYRVARYTLNGDYLGISTVENGRIQLCPDTSEKLNAAFVFGTTYSQSVSDMFMLLMKQFSI